MKVQYNKASRQIVGYGMVLGSPDPDTIDVSDIAVDQELKLLLPGIKVLEEDGIITVTEPVPLPPPTTQPDFGTDAPVDNTAVLQALQTLQTYLKADPTTLNAAQNTQALKTTIRMVLYIFKRAVTLP